MAQNGKLISRFLLFFFFAAFVFLKCILFQHFCLRIVLFNPLHCGWITWWAFWLPKMAVSLLLASPLFFTKTTWWSLIWMLVIDFWIIANFIYFRANSLFLSLDAILMAGNLKGFTSSILTYFDWRFWIFVTLAVLYVLPWWFFRNSSPSWIAGCSIFVFSIVLSLCAGECNYRSFKQTEGRENLNFEAEWLNPFVTPKDIASQNWQMEQQQFSYITQHSILSYSVNMIVEGVKIYQQREHLRPLSQDEEEYLQSLPDVNANQNLHPEYNLIIILVESLESWVLQMKDDNGIEVMPSLNAFLASRQHFFCPRITSQVKFGVSGDGQMIINTGLLPISSGAACLLYSHNTYPGFAHFFNSSAVVNPVKGTWNKTDAFRNYGYRKLMEPDDLSSTYNKTEQNEFWIDNKIFHVSMQTAETMMMNPPYCEMVLTISTHQPFDLYDKNYSLNFSDDTPHNIREYMNAMHYTDYHMGVFLKWLEERNIFDNTVLVITGDHTVFHNLDFENLQKWANNKPLSVASEPNYCPLIMLSPDIQTNITVDEICYQMDIFPTILSAVGLEDYSWHGFGHNLLDSSSFCGQNESFSKPTQAECLPTFSVPEAFSLSDLIIRTNAFAK